MFRRSLVVAALLAAAAGGVACSKAAPTHAVVPGARAGVVLEATGTVSATRGGVARPLKVGDEVSGDDQIATGADGAVLIELDHNHVTFTLPAGKAQLVSSSLAWNQPVAAARPTTTDESSAAAGRAIERSAVDTAASTKQPGGGALDDDVEPAKKEEKEDLEDRKANAIASPKQRGEAGGGNSDKGSTSQNRKPTFKDVAPDKTTENVQLDTMTPTLGAVPKEHAQDKETDDPVDPPKPQPAAGPSLAVAVAGGLTEGEVTAKISAGDLIGCWKTVPATTTITLAVHSAGYVTKVTSSDTAASTCLTGALEKVKFAPRRAATTITLTLTK